MEKARRQPPEPPPVQTSGQLASDHQRARLPLVAASGVRQAAVHLDPLAAIRAGERPVYVNAVEVAPQIVSAEAVDHSQAGIAGQ